jgi:hypothetical protein
MFTRILTHIGASYDLPCAISIKGGKRVIVFQSDCRTARRQQENRRHLLKHFNDVLLTFN